MRERTYDAYRVQPDAQGNNGYGYCGSTLGRGSFRGRGRGGMPEEVEARFFAITVIRQDMYLETVRTQLRHVDIAE